MHGLPAVSIAEFIEPIRVFEDAIALYRLRHSTSYPIHTWDGAPDHWLGDQPLVPYMQWRLNRQSPPRALCCGSHRFQPLQTDGVRIKHLGCNEGLIKGWWEWGTRSARDHMDQRIYDPKGVLIGIGGEPMDYGTQWKTSPAAYVPPEVEAPAGIPSRWIWLEGR